MTLDEELQRAARHVMVFGDSKTGKSTLASKLALKFKLIWISCDGGHSVLRKLPLEAQKNIDLIVIPDTRAAPFAFDTVKKLTREGGKKMQVCYSHGVVECATCKKSGASLSTYEFRNNPRDTIVVIDHMTAVSDSCKNVITMKMPEDYKLQLDDWGALRFHLTNLLKEIQVAGYNICALAQGEEVKMEDGSKKINPAIGSSEFTKMTAQYFDDVVYTCIKNRSHKAGSSTTYETSIVTGSRGDGAIESLAEPSLDMFFDGSMMPPESKEYGASVLESIRTESEQANWHADAVATVEAAEAAATTQAAETMKIIPASAKATDLLAALRAKK